MEKKNTNKVLIAIIIVLAFIVVIMAAVIWGYIVGEKQVKETDIQKTTQIRTEPAMTVDVTKYATGVYLDGDTTVNEIVHKTGGDILALEKVQDGKVSFKYTSIQSAPSSRLAQITIEDLEINEDGVGKFSFDEDGWGNRGIGTIAFKGNDKIMLSINISKMNEESMWDIGNGTSEFEYEKNEEMPDLY